MKNPIIKVFVVALTLALLTGLLIPTAPVSAGMGTWTDAGLPDQFVSGSNIKAMGISPDGNTILVFNGDYELEDEDIIKGGFVKSTDGGLTFSANNLNTDEDDRIDISNVTQIVFSPDYTNDKTILLVGDHTLYRTEDSGRSWEDIKDSSVGDVVSADISYDHNDRENIVVADESNVWLYNEKGAEWTNISELDGFHEGDIFAVKFSTQYEDDGEILAISASSEEVLLQTCIVPNEVEDAEWNTDLKYVGFSDVSGLVSAFICLPDDYSKTGSSAKVFVGLNSIESWESDVYRVIMTTGNDSQTLKKASEWLNPDGRDILIYSMDYKGTASDGRLAVGLSDEIKVNPVAATSTSSADWLKASDYKLPTGMNFSVTFSKNSDSLFAGSQNGSEGDPDYYLNYSDSFGSVFAVSTDYINYDGMSLINVKNPNEIKVSNPLGFGTAIRYVLMKANSNTAQMVFKSTDSGSTWKEIYAFAQNVDDEYNRIFNLAVNGNKVCLAMKYSYLLISSDEGTTFDKVIVRNTDNDDEKKILALGISGDDNYTARPGGEIYKNNSRTPAELPEIGDYEICSLILHPDYWIVLTSPVEFGPPCGPVYFSSDNGVTFTKLGDKEMSTVTFDVSSRTLYAVEMDEKYLYSWNLDTSTDWNKLCTIKIWDEEKSIEKDYVDYIKNLSLSPDNKVLYLTIGTDEDISQILRCINLNEPKPRFEPVPGSSEDDLSGNFQYGIPTIISDNTSNTFFAALDQYEMPQEDGEILSLMKTYTDIWVKGPVVTAPANNASIPTNSIFKWNAAGIGTGSITYKGEIAVDPDFQGIFYDFTTQSTAYQVTNLPKGSDYYFRVRVAGIYSDSTLSTQWSQTVKFRVGDSNSIYITDNSELPNGEAKLNYSTTLHVSGGTPTYSWSVKKGSKLPSGLKLKANKDTSTATLSGKPSLSGKSSIARDFTFFIQVKDKNGIVNEDQEFTLHVYPSITLTFSSIPSGSVNTPFQEWIPQASGGDEDYTWTKTGSWPDGLEFDENTGAITGTPTSAGTFKITIKVTDGLGGSASKSLSLKINPVLSITAVELPSADIGIAYKSITLKATGGTKIYFWSIVEGEGELPPGFYLSPRGVITGRTGTDTTPGLYEFTVQVKDTNNCTALRDFSINVNDQLDFTTEIPENDVLGTVSYELNPSGGNGTYKFTKSGKLPKVLKLVTRTEDGTTKYFLEGTLSKTGTYTFTLKLTDGLKAVKSNTFTLTVD